MKYLTNLDMSQNEIQNFIVQPLSVAPKNPKLGQVYTDTSGESPELKWWNGKEWVSLGAVKVPENFPTAVNPSVSVSILTGDSQGEVGSSLNVAYKATFNPGSYTFGPDTGITVTSWRVYDNSGSEEILTEAAGTFSDVVPEEGEDYEVIVEAAYSAGAIPLTDQGNPCPSVQIKEGVVTASASTSLESVQGYRKYFYGATDIFELNSENIRANLTHSNSSVGSGVTFDLTITKGSNQVTIAFPTEAGLSLESVIDTGAFNIDVYDIFTKSVVDVEGANGYEAISYDVYTYTPDMSLNKNTYKVTIS